MSIKRKEHNNTIQFKKVGNRRVLGKATNMTSYGTLQCELNHYTHIKLNLVFTPSLSKYGSTQVRNNIKKLNESIIRLLKREGYYIPYER